jgi:hypothetical protein
MDIDTMVENHFKKNRDIFGFEAITELIEEVMDSMDAEGIPRLDESAEALLAEAKDGFSAAKFFDSIFTPNITEEVGVVDSEARKEFQRSMKQLQGKTLREKLASVKVFMKGDEAMATDAAKVLSYLTFLKAMQEVFRDYSPSGSGFLLEAFLAGLLRGQQVVEVTDETGGSLPITDYETGTGEPVSLKRLTGGESKTPIKGSLNNLVHHLTLPENQERGITYVIAAIFGDKEQVAFYEFKINADNFIPWVGQFVSIDEEGLQQLQAFTGADPGALQEQDERAELAKIAQTFRKNVEAIQAAIGIPPGTPGKKEHYDGKPMPSFDAYIKPAGAAFSDKKSQLLTPQGAQQIVKAATRFSGKYKGALEAMGPEAVQLNAELLGVTAETPFRDYYKVANQLGKAFRDMLKTLPPEAKAFSYGPMATKQARDPEGTKKLGQLSALPDNLKAVFPAWMKAEPEQMRELVKRSTTQAKRAKKAAASGKQADLTEAAGVDKTQFSIDQGRIMTSEYYITTVAVDRKSLLGVTRKYNKVVKDRLSPIFTSVDRLMNRLQMFYAYKKLGAAQQASQECEVLKKNVDEEIKTAAAEKK